MEETRPTRDRARCRRVRPVDTGASVTAGGQGRNHGADAAAQKIFITKSWGRTASTLSKSSKEFDCVRERIKGQILSLKKTKQSKIIRDLKQLPPKRRAGFLQTCDMWQLVPLCYFLASAEKAGCRHGRQIFELIQSWEFSSFMWKENHELMPAEVPSTYINSTSPS